MTSSDITLCTSNDRIPEDAVFVKQLNNQILLTHFADKVPYNYDGNHS